jgi:hypothetical protein
MQNKKALVICHGRGTYNKTELGYLQRWHTHKNEFLALLFDFPETSQQVTINSLDSAEKYNINYHTRGDNASALVYACAYADF